MITILLDFIGNYWDLFVGFCKEYYDIDDVEWIEKELEKLGIHKN